MKKVFASLLGAVALTVAASASAGVSKAYWATSGMFGPFPINGLIPSIPADQVRDVTIPVSMWIVEHDKASCLLTQVTISQLQKAAKLTGIKEPVTS